VGQTVVLEGLDGLALTTFAEVNSMVVRQVEGVEPGPRQRRGVFGRGLKAEAVPAVDAALRGAPYGEGALEVAYGQIGRTYVGPDALE